MDLVEVMRTTGSCRAFTDQPVPDDVLARCLDAARFAPSGGNRQGWKVVAVRDAEVRKRLRDLYAEQWAFYVKGVERGIVPFNTYLVAKDGPPPTPRHLDPQWLAGVNAFAENVHTIPLHLLFFVDLRALAVADHMLDRQSVVGGGSIYPFVHNTLLALRNEGLGSSLTTILCPSEAAVKELLGVPGPYALAAFVLVGWPAKRLPTKLSRKPVAEIATFDRFDGPPIGAS